MTDFKIPVSRPPGLDGLGHQLIFARELRGIHQRDLATALSIPQTRLHRYENGLATPKPEELTALSAQLGVPVTFWTQPPTLSVEPCWRSTKMLVGEHKRITRLGKRIRDTIARAIASIEIEPSLPWKTFDPADYDGTDQAIGEAIAADLRVLWSIPPGPIRNLTEYAEAAGFFIHYVDFGNEQVDGFTWPTFEPRVIILAEGRPGCRRRMNLAHEIAHHAMGHLAEHKRAEDQAKAFAGALLMPAGDFDVTWPSILTMDTLTQLKLHWGVSIQAMLHRAQSLNLISHRVYQNWVIYFSRNGGRKVEPGYVPLEKASTVSHVLTAITEQLGVAINDLAEAYGWLPDEFLGSFKAKASPAVVLRAPLPSAHGGPEATSHFDEPMPDASEKIIQMPARFSPQQPDLR